MHYPFFNSNLFSIVTSTQIRLQWLALQTDLRKSCSNSLRKILNTRDLYATTEYSVDIGCSPAKFLMSMPYSTYILLIIWCLVTYGIIRLAYTAIYTFWIQFKDAGNFSSWSCNQEKFAFLYCIDHVLFIYMFLFFILRNTRMSCYRGFHVYSLIYFNCLNRTSNIGLILHFSVGKSCLWRLG